MTLTPLRHAHTLSQAPDTLDPAELGSTYQLLICSLDLSLLKCTLVLMLMYCGTKYLNDVNDVNVSQRHFIRLDGGDKMSVI